MRTLTWLSWTLVNIALATAIIVTLFVKLSLPAMERSWEIDDFLESTCTVTRFFEMDVRGGLAQRRNFHLCHIKAQVTYSHAHVNGTVTANVTSICEKRHGCQQDRSVARFDCRLWAAVGTQHSCIYNPDDPEDVLFFQHVYSFNNITLLQCLIFFFVAVTSGGYMYFRPPQRSRLRLHQGLWAFVLIAYALLIFCHGWLLSNRSIFRTGICDADKDGQRSGLFASLVCAILGMLLLATDHPPRTAGMRPANIWGVLFSEDSEERDVHPVSQILGRVIGGRKFVIFMFYISTTVFSVLASFVTCVDTQCDPEVGGGFDACQLTIVGGFVNMEAMLTAWVARHLDTTDEEYERELREDRAKEWWSNFHHIPVKKQAPRSTSTSPLHHAPHATSPPPLSIGHER